MTPTVNVYPHEISDHHLIILDFPKKIVTKDEKYKQVQRRYINDKKTKTIFPSFYLR